MKEQKKKKKREEDETPKLKKPLKKPHTQKIHFFQKAR